MTEAAVTDPRLRWFNGDATVLDLYLRVAYIAHAWDDLVDGDKSVKVHEFMANVLLHLPMNAAYQRFGAELRTLFFTGAASYMAANVMERSGDAHKLELAHYLRYQIATVGVFLIAATNGGIERAAPMIAEAMPFMVPERLADYLKEHAPC